MFMSVNNSRKNVYDVLLRDGPLEKLWEGGWGIFEPQEFFFRHQIPRMNFFQAIA